MALHPKIAEAKTKQLYSFMSEPSCAVALGVLPGIMCATTLQNGFIFGIASAVSLLLMFAFAPMLRAISNDFIRPAVVLMVSASLATLIGFVLRIIDPVAYQAFGPYVALMATNALVLLFVEKPDYCVTGMKSRIASLLFCAVCIIATMSFIGLVNAMLAEGIIFGLTITEVADAPIAVFARPFGSLLILVLVTAFINSCTGGER